MTVVSSGRELLFSPQDPVRSRLLQIIGDSKRTVDLSCYVFTLQELADTLAELLQAGRRVRLITSAEPDRRPGYRHQKTPQQRLQDANVSRLVALGMLYEDGLSKFGRILHGKYGIIDNSIAFHGSYNWSSDAENQGNHVCIEMEAEGIRPFIRNFEEDWQRLHEAVQ